MPSSSTWRLSSLLFKFRHMSCGSFIHLTNINRRPIPCEKSHTPVSGRNQLRCHPPASLSPFKAFSEFGMSPYPHSRLQSGAPGCPGILLWDLR